MPRVTPIYRPDDFPGGADACVDALFAHLFPGNLDPVIGSGHSGVAIAARNPALALGTAKMSAPMALDLGWSKRRDLRELAVQTVNHTLGCTFSFETRIAPAASAGISEAQQRTLVDWRTSPLFDDEQRLVIEYVGAVVSGNVPNALFARVKDVYGETGAVEFTALVSFFAYWAMFLKATAPELGEPEVGQS